MNFLDEIYSAYVVLCGWLDSQETHDPPASGIPWLRTFELTDYAFFVLLFGQLEDYINQEYEQLLGRPWEEAAFEHRVNCVFAENDESAELIMDY